MSKEFEQVAALSGLMQSCLQVNQLAYTGEWDEVAAQPCVHSLFQMDADSVNDIYGGIEGLKPGAEHLQALLLRKARETEANVARYTAVLLNLERKLVKQEPVLNKISQGLYAIRNEFDICDISNTTLLSRIAELYLQTVSKIPPRIQVYGEQHYLTRMDNTWKVRSLLFCGLRAAVLWRQLGGTQWQLFWRKKRLLSATQEILNA